MNSPVLGIWYDVHPMNWVNWVKKVRNHQLTRPAAEIRKKRIG
jgi:hypothetical protein